MDITHAIILGIVEGITEFLPISSTAHLVLTQKILEIPSSEFLGTFTIAIQLGAILAVVLLYVRRLDLIRKVWLKIAFAFLPTALIGFLFYRVVRYFLEGESTVLLWALALGGIVLIIFELFAKEQTSEITVTRELQSFSYTKAFLIGVAQALALIPGVSRSGATIIAGRALGLSRSAIVEFSFLLAIPTMVSATAYDVFKQAPYFSADNVQVLAVGFVVSFISAYFSVRWLLKFIKTHNFIAFGFYRIVIALACIPLFF